MTTELKAIREALVVNRQLEFFTEAELEKQIGQRRDYWAAVIVGELVDNALDHCEEFGILPTVTVTVNEDNIVVADNGKGIPPEVVATLADFSTRTSTRVGYVSPTRGQQGNATNCLFAVPYVHSGGTACTVEIDTPAACHKITTKVDPIAMVPAIDQVTEAGKVQIGTSIKVDLACSVSNPGTARIVSLLQEYAAFNPHASFSLSYFGREYNWDRTSETINKWTAGYRDPAHWHDYGTLQNLVASIIHKDRTAGTSRTVRDFLKQFAGCQRSDTLKRILDETELARCDLGSLVDASGVNSNAITRLLNAMVKHTESPKPIKLGSIGKPHIESVLGGEVLYKRVVGLTAAGLPFGVEVAFRDRDDGDYRQLFTGVNFSVDVRFPAYEHAARVLEKARVDEFAPCDVLIHVTTPRVSYTDRGKTKADLPPSICDAIDDAIQVVTKKYTAKIKALERDQGRALKAARAAKVSLKDAIFGVMEESIDAVSHGGECAFSARSHYYKIRPLIQKKYGLHKDLSQGYLDSVIDEWESINGIIELRTRDPRGFLLEPHTAKQIPLGTAQVERYSIPPNLYHTIIYVEKKGLLPNFQFGKIAEKFDAAIICAEGYAVRAAQSLMQAAANGHSMKVFVFHDADPAGYGIARAIGESSGAHKFDFQVIDAGLRLDEALAMGLETETFTRKKKLPKAIAWTELEQRYFQGERRMGVGKNGKDQAQWVNCERVELNALAANPKQFVEWVESKLQEHGATKKLLPNKSAVVDHTREAFHRQQESAVYDALANRIDLPAHVQAICSKLPADFSKVNAEVRRWSKQLRPESWSTVCDSIARRMVDQQRDQIDAAVRAVMIGGDR